MISKKTWPTWSLLILLLLGAIPKAHAIPAFSRQTGLSCAACHVGAFGPQLTPLGREFKLKGYMLKSGGGFNPKISAQVLESFLHTQKDQATPPAPGFNTNNNWELQTVDMYLAGPISDHMGLFTLASYSQNGHTVGWDMTDLRYARTSQLGHMGDFAEQRPHNHRYIQYGASMAIPLLQRRPSSGSTSHPHHHGCVRKRLSRPDCLHSNR